jgi:hypothetical protein
MAPLWPVTNHHVVSSQEILNSLLATTNQVRIERRAKAAPGRRTPRRRLKHSGL